MGWLGRARWVSLASIVTLFGAAACTESDSDDASSRSNITSVPQSSVKRQSIGNCWSYAIASWIESLHLDATGKQLNVSESWMTYWHWFDQIVSGEPLTEIATGGDFEMAANIIGRYGLMDEGDFLPSEANAEMSERQKAALEALNLSLKSGVLANPTARADRALVRKELDRVWKLDATRIRRIDAVFGAKVERRLDNSFDAFVAASDNKIINSMDLEARLKNPETGQFFVSTVAEALGVGGATFAWKRVDYPATAQARRDYWKRIQRAQHDRQPVLLVWTIDFNALQTDSRVSKAQLDRLGPGHQGAHMTVMHDYQAQVPGIGLLKAGAQATPQQMEAALSDDTKIEFVRIKNSWGGIRPDRWISAPIPGYHDLELAYLNGPIKKCEEVPGAAPRCDGEMVPLMHVVMPPGY